MARMEILSINYITQPNGFFFNFQFACFAGATIAGGVTRFNIFLVRSISFHLKIIAILMKYNPRYKARSLWRFRSVFIRIMISPNYC